MKTINSENPLSKFTSKLDKQIIDVINKKKKGSNESTKDGQTNNLQVLKDFIDSDLESTLLDPYRENIKIFNDILKRMLDIPPNHVSYVLCMEIEDEYKEFTKVITLLRSAKNLLKVSNYNDEFIDEISSLMLSMKKIVKLLMNSHTEILNLINENILDPPVLIEDVKDISYYEPVEMTPLTNKVDKWYDLNSIKQTDYTHIKKKKNIPIESLYIDLLSSMKKKKKTLKRKKKKLTLPKIVQMQEFKQITNYFNLLYEKLEIKCDKPKFKTSIQKTLAYLMMKSALIIKEDDQFTDTMTKKKIFTELTEFVENARVQYSLVIIEKVLNQPQEPPKNMNKYLSKLVLTTEKAIEQKTLNQDIADTEKKKYFQREITKLYEILNKQHDWYLGIQEYLTPYEKVIRKPLKIISNLRDELDRANYAFVAYLDNIIEQNTIAKLNSKIDDKVEEIQDILHDYEKQTSELIDRNFPESDMVSKILDSFKEKIKTINQDVLTIIKEYKEDERNVYDSLKRWEDKFEEIKNRMEFLVSALFNSLLRKYKSVMQKEQSFFTDLLKTKVEDEGKTLESFSIDMIMPEKLTEKQIRERMSKIDTKIKELNTLKDRLKKERSNYEAFLKGYLKDHGEISQKCVICHKQIDVVEDKYIKCEFCNRMMHYLCGAWWLEKHNSCPVCNNEFLVPNSGLFETDYYDPEIDGNLEDHDEYTEIDLNKYPPEFDEVEKSKEQKNDNEAK
ncbi:MAG: hypothetical protein GF364_20430 [Candidatus Lokiarchaeota archaeon]|nr:hypothetical protein [Candidatus Lokiarchaeota archaeon]